MTRAGLAAGDIGTVAYSVKPDGRVMARVRYRKLDGIEARIARTGETKAAARRAVMAAARERMRDASDLAVALTPDSTLAELAAAYLAVQSERNVGLVDQYLADERHIIERWVAAGPLSTKPLRQLRASSIVAEHRRIGTSLQLTGRARQWLTAMRKLLDFAVELDLVQLNHARELRVKRPKPARGYTPDALTISQVRATAQAYADRPDRRGPRPMPLLLDVIDLITGSGLRVGEALGLRWADVDLDAEVPVVRVRATVVEGHGGRKRLQERPKSDDSRRGIPVPPYVVEMLRRRHAEMLGQHAYVFETASGKPTGMHQVRVQLWKVRAWAATNDDVADIDPGMAMHALRRAVATAVTDDVDIVAAARVLGHRESAITEAAYRERQRLAPDVRRTLQALGRPEL